MKVESRGERSRFGQWARRRVNTAKYGFEPSADVGRCVVRQMYATRPRDSILDLFDPLVSPVPSHDAPDPDSDKENSNPPRHYDCSMTDAFFRRTLKQPSPVVLKRRLIDIGDMTTEDPSMLSMLIDEEELDDSMCDENDTMTLPPLPAATPARVVLASAEHATLSNPSPRTPLGEISLDRDITPIARTKMYRRQAPSTFSSSGSTIHQSPDNLSIASIANANNATAASLASPGPTNSSPKCHNLIPEDHAPNTKPNDVETPHITISSTDELSSSLSTLHLDTPTGTPLEDTSHPFASPFSQSSEESQSYLHAGLRANSSSKTSSHHPNRRSMDLYSSFHIQLQSEDASFDLLNDKISFFTSTIGTDSFLNSMEEDESFDMVVEEAKLQKAIEKIQQVEAQEKAGKDMVMDTEQQSSMPNAEIANSTPSPPPATTPPKVTFETSASLTPPRSLGSNPPESPSFVFGQGKHKAKASALSEEPIIAASDSVTATVCSPIPREQPVWSTNVHTPAPSVRETAPPPPVPALRIVKRAKRAGHEKSSSSSSASSTETASASQKAFKAATSQKPTATAIGAPPPIARRMSTTTHKVAPVRVAGGGVAPAASAVVIPPRMGTGPRRVAIVDSQANTIKSRAGFGNPKVVPPASMSGPRRVLVAPSVPTMATAAPVPALSKVPVASGLKAPAKYGTGANHGQRLRMLRVWEVVSGIKLMLNGLFPPDVWPMAVNEGEITLGEEDL
ncbi:hypothetical protein D9615_001359 [Tricholomella constricta]|uniref:Uncharacterized protein n=1 Tax=Tricholomella constricta TaxID=117010 RepID=A0A8H5M8Q2_9AGAR|nr:hypothetical protein D9615_001359 [Tricholomella constricta]